MITLSSRIGKQVAEHTGHRCYEFITTRCPHGEVDEVEVTREGAKIQRVHIRAHAADYHRRKTGCDCALATATPGAVEGE